MLGLKFRISPEAFFQVHTEAAERLASALCECTRRPAFSAPFAKQATEASKEERPRVAVPLLLDVCCGAGTLGLVLARHCDVEKVWGVESCAPAVADARVNAQLNSLEGVAQFECGNAEVSTYRPFLNRSIYEGIDISDGLPATSTEQDR